MKHSDAKMTREDKRSDDLDWMAFQYVADELSELQRQEFERQLAVDSEARDAVVRAMTLAEDLSGAFRTMVRSAPPAVASRANRMSVLLAIAAIILVSVSATWYLYQFERPADASAAWVVEATEATVAVAWAESQDPVDVEPAWPFDEASGGIDESTELDGEPVGWLVSALAELELSADELRELGGDDNVLEYQ